MAHQNRGTEDCEETRNFLQRVRDDLSPWRIVQALGFVLLSAFIVGVNWNKVSASVERLDAVDTRLVKIEEFRNSAQTDIAVMKQELGELHDWYAFDHGKEKK